MVIAFGMPHTCTQAHMPMCLGMKPRLCVIRAVGGIARYPRPAQRDTTRRLFEPNLQNQKTKRATRRDEETKKTDGWRNTTQHEWNDKRQRRTANETRTSKCVRPPCPQSSMLAYAWRSRCCVIYVSRRPSPCDTFMQHNIEHKGEGDYNNQSAYDLRTCTDVANFIPSTVSVNVVKDPCHIHWTDKTARAYAQHSTMRWHTKLQESNWKTLKTRLIPLIVTHLH